MDSTALQSVWKLENLKSENIIALIGACYKCILIEK